MNLDAISLVGLIALGGCDPLFGGRAPSQSFDLPIDGLTGVQLRTFLAPLDGPPLRRHRS